MHLFAHRKFLRNLLALGTAILLSTPFMSARAQAPLAKTQVPGYYRMMLGQYEVTALFDGVLSMDVKRLTNAPPAVIQLLLARKFVGNPKMQTAVNAYLINTGEHLVLVDTGGGTIYGTQMGNVLNNMKAAGYRPEQVDMVILTHLHGDHIAGLLDASGKPAFPNAQIQVSKVESDFWLSSQNAAAAPAEWQRIFTAARNIAAPYIATGQWHTFVNGKLFAPGIQGISAAGHTPGHTALAIESDGKKLLIWGDLVHSHAVQFTWPDAAFDFDVKPKQAIATRRTFLKAAAESGVLVAGMHLPFPGIGHVRAEDDGMYAWVPLEFTPLAKP